VECGSKQKPDRQAVEAALDKALALEAEGDFQGARKSLLDSLAEFPEQPALLSCLANCERFLGNVDGSIMAATKAVSLAPKASLASVALYHALIAAGREDDAIDEIFRFLPVGKSGVYDEAIANARHSNEAQDDSTECTGIAARLAEIGDKQSRQAPPSSYGMWVVRSHIQGLPALRERALSDAENFQDNGYTLIERGQIDDAEAYIRAAIALNPDDAWNYMYLGNIHFHRNNFTAALDQFNKLAKSWTGSGAPHWAMGQVYYALGQIEEANRAFLEAVRVEPDSSVVRRQLRRWLDELDEIYGPEH